MSKRMLSALLAAVLLGSSLVACTAPTDTPEDTTASTSVTEAETTVPETSVFDILPKTTYDGRAYNILVSVDWSVDMLDQMWVESGSGDVVLDSVYTRNLSVEETYDVTITPRTITYSSLSASLENEIAAGQTDTDLVSHAPNQLAPLAAKPCFLDIGTLPYTDMTKPWYVKGVNDALEIGGKQYLFLTDMGFVYASATNVMLYNRDMANTLSLPNIQQMALDGDWTLDRFEEYSAAAASDLNGNGQKDPTDRYGIAILWNEMVDTLPVSFGQHITEKDANGYPQLVYKTERMSDIITACNRIFNTGDACYLSDTSKGEGFKTQQEMFRDGYTLFCILNISSITKRLRDMEEDYVALPLPKFDEDQQDYYTGNSIGSSTIFAIPTTVPDPAFASVMLEAMSAEGARLVLPAFIESSVKLRFSNDPESKEMYDIILAGRTIDFSSIYDNSGIFLLFRNLMKEKSDDFISRYDSIAPATEQKFKDIIEQYKKHG